ncbi:MAG: hypothetical protein KAU95_01100, partial [Candidatus Aenigmarchaeota archaeon]|nr:hypothetical protein [Candidatus Aenigmarchaeota archaeon]
MRWKVLGLVFVILLVIGFLPLSLAAPCPGVTGCTDKAFSGRFCYHGEDITDIILKHYVIDGKFYLPENVTIYGCRYYHTATIEKGFCISVGLKGIYIGPGKCDPIIPGIGIHVGKGNCTQVGPLGIYLGQGECTPGGLGICTSTGPNGSYTGPGKCVSVGQKKLTQIGLGICICVGQDLIYIGPGECTHAGYNFLSIAPHGIYIGPGDSVYVGPNGIHVGTWGCTKFEPLHISISTATLPIYSCKETIEEMPEENIKYRKFSLAETG